MSKLGFMILLLWVNIAIAQDSTFNDKKITAATERWIDQTQSKCARIESGVTTRTLRYLKKFKRIESRLKSKIQIGDSIAAMKLFEGSADQYRIFEITNRTPSDYSGIIAGEYLPYLDSIKGALSFLNQSPEVANNLKVKKEALESCLSNFNHLQGRLNQAELVKAFVQKRKEQINQYLNTYTALPKNLKKEYQAITKELYYYSQQIREYKNLINDPGKLTQTALTLLNKVPAFQKFMKENSVLGGLFSLPGNYHSQQAIEGMQTVEQVQQMLAGKMAQPGANVQGALQQQLSTVQSQLEPLKKKLLELGGGSADIEMPDFTPNNSRTKTFLKRLEYGTNLQTTRANQFYPNTIDVGISVGYQINSNSVIGLGASYKIGLGKDIRQIAISNAGVGFRSFLNVRIKGSFFASGGLEYNYQKPFNSFSRIKSLEDWQSSGLLGITKTVSLKSKIFKKTSVQALWDFLSYRQKPASTPFKFRVGYNF